MVGCSGSGSLMRLSLRCWLEQPSSEVLMRLEDLFLSSQESTPVALSKRPQCLMVTAWKLSSSPWSPLQGGSCSWYGSLHPSEHVIQERARQKPHSIFDPTLEVTYHPFVLYSVGHADQPWYSMGGDSIMTRIPEDGDYWIHLENWLSQSIREISMLTYGGYNL